MSGEHLAKIKSETAKAILRAAYHLEVEDPYNYLPEIKLFLREGGNLVLYGNHIAFDDPAFAILFHARYLDPKRERHLIIPASHWHTNPDNNKQFYLATKAAEFFFGAEIFRLIQSYMINDPKFGSYTAKDASDNHLNFFSQLRNLRRKRVPTTLLIYPEGHRSENGGLQSIEEGLTTAGNIMKPTIYVPLATYYKTPFSRDKLNLRTTGRSAHISVGLPYFLLEGQKKPSAANLMWNLARNLPLHMQGPYAQSLSQGM